jgi:hypothetical protein
VDLSEPLSRGICSNSRVGLTSGENAQAMRASLFGEHNCQHVAVQPLQCLLDPSVCGPAAQ